jgi:hypothetical protein
MTKRNSFDFSGVAMAAECQELLRLHDDGASFVEEVSRKLRR